MSGNNLKLMGLGALNIAVAVALTAAYLMQMGGVRLQALTEEDIRVFLYESSNVTSGKKLGFNSGAVTRYFMNHVAEDGTFKRTLKSEVPGMKSRDVSMDKKEFINDVLTGMRNKGIHDVSLVVDNIRISQSGRDGTADITSRESASIQKVGKADEEAEIMPIVEISHCKQTLSISNSHTIQLQKTDCVTNIQPVKSD